MSCVRSKTLLLMLSRALGIYGTCKNKADRELLLKERGLNKSKHCNENNEHMLRYSSHCLKEREKR